MSDQDPTHEDAIDQLRAKADEATKLQQALLFKDRELAFLRAGIPTESKPAQAFIEKYDGELDSAKIKEAAVEWGLWKPEGSDAEPAPDPTADDREKLRGGGAPSAGSAPQGHPTERALEEFREMRKAGITREDASMAVIGALIKGGVEGDERVIVPDHGIQRTFETKDIPYQDGRARRS